MISDALRNLGEALAGNAPRTPSILLLAAVRARALAEALRGMEAPEPSAQRLREEAACLDSLGYSLTGMALDDDTTAAKARRACVLPLVVGELCGVADYIARLEAAVPVPPGFAADGPEIPNVVQLAAWRKPREVVSGPGGGTAA